MTWNVQTINGEHIEHLSASSLGRFMSCPESWRLHYLVQKPEAPNVYASWGRAHHEALAYNFSFKLQHGYDAGEQIVVDAFNSSFSAIAEEAGETMDWRKESYERVMRVGPGLIRAYMRSVAPQVKPITVEENRLLFDEDLPIPVLMVADLVTETEIIDYKTSSKSIQKPKPDWIFQADCYRLLWQKPLSWHVCVKGEPQFVTILPSLHNKDRDFSTVILLRQLAEQIQYLYNTIGPHSVWPGTGMHLDQCWKCPLKPCYWWRGL